MTSVFEFYHAFFCFCNQLFSPALFKYQLNYNKQIKVTKRLPFLASKYHIQTLLFFFTICLIIGY